MITSIRSRLAAPAATPPWQIRQVEADDVLELHDDAELAKVRLRLERVSERLADLDAERGEAPEPWPLRPYGTALGAAFGLQTLCYLVGGAQLALGTLLIAGGTVAMADHLGRTLRLLRDGPADDRPALLGRGAGALLAFAGLQLGGLWSLAAAPLWILLLLASSAAVVLAGFRRQHGDLERRFLQAERRRALSELATCEARQRHRLREARDRIDALLAGLTLEAA